MRLLRPLLLAYVAMLPSVAPANTVAGVDVISHLQRDRIERLGAQGAFRHTNAGLVGQMLVDPGSPYSRPIDAPAFVNDVDWPDVLERLPGKLSSDEALAILQWDLGMTRARPGLDVMPRDGYGGPFVAASAAKADVAAPIFWHMLDLTGYRHSTRAATYAVAMEILRRQLDDVRSTERRVALGIDADVYDRVMAARHLDEVTSYDLKYLSAIVQHRLVHWRAGERASTGSRALPTAYRIARVAAAYRDRQGYVTGYPCRPDATPVAESAGMGDEGDARPLCFVAATDRAVHRWYLEESRRQAIYVPQQHENGLMRLAAIAGLVLPLLDIAGLAEVVEAAVADDLAAAEAIAPADAEVAAERADVLSCQIPE